MNLVIKDAVRQILWRVASAIGGFLVIKIITPYLGPLRFGDYSTILKYFAIRSAFADFGVYVIALKTLGKIKNNEQWAVSNEQWVMSNAWNGELATTYSKFVSTRAVMIGIVYMLALIVAYFIPAYTSNPYIVRGLPIGMLFSASFMSAGILQLPLQLFRKMEQLSIALILARIAQIWVLIVTVYIAFTHVEFGTWSPNLLPFGLILGSVLISGVVQGAYVYRTGKKYLPLKRTFDRSFTKDIIQGNRQYWLAYYLSSFHTLLVLMMLWRMYPTIEGYTYVGIRALALSLIEILLIVPSALGNSLIHKVASLSHEEMRQRFGNLLMLVMWIGCYTIVIFTVFSPHIITFLGGNEYLSTVTHRGSEKILPFLAIVLTLSFAKQIFNYLFVSTGHQNTLLGINLLGVTIGLAVGIPLIQRMGLQGWVITQLLLELCFLWGSIVVAHRQKIVPTLSYSKLFVMLAITVLLTVVLPASLLSDSIKTPLLRMLQAFLLTALLTAVSLRRIKQFARGL